MEWVPGEGEREASEKEERREGVMWMSEQGWVEDVQKEKGWNWCRGRGMTWAVRNCSGSNWFKSMAETDING